MSRKRVGDVELVLIDRGSAERGNRTEAALDRRAALPAFGAQPSDPLANPSPADFVETKIPGKGYELIECHLLGFIESIETSHSSIHVGSFGQRRDDLNSELRVQGIPSRMQKARRWGLASYHPGDCKIGGVSQNPQLHHQRCIIAGRGP
jgi:hypothetical protein